MNFSPFTLSPMTASAASVIARWSYPPPYEAYSYAIHQDDWLMDSSTWGTEQFFLTDGHSVAAHVCCQLYEGAYWVGWSLAPELCGQGNGPAFVCRCIEELTRLLSLSGDLFLRVAASNARAVTAYHRAGFTYVETITDEIAYSDHPEDFLVMKYTIEPKSSTTGANTMTDLWKIEAHAHTAEVSLCAKMPAAEMIRQCKAAGCDAVLVTDHYTPEFFPADLSPEDYPARLHDFFAGYRAAKEEGDRIGVSVFPALEVRITAGMEDYLIYGISPEELIPLGSLAHLTLEQLLNKVRSTQHGLLIQAHPFRGYLNCQPAHLLDGVEINNANPRHDSHNDRALAFAEENGLLRTAGSDVHQLGDAGAALMTAPPFTSIQEFAALVRAGKTHAPIEV